MSKFILSFLLLISLTELFAQQPVPGFNIGFNLSRGQYRPDEGIDRRIIGGFDGGLFLRFNGQKNFSFQPELNYVINGVELNDGVTEHSIKLQYLSIAAIAKWRVLQKLSLLAGPAHGILLTAWDDPSGGGPSTQIKGHFKFTDLVMTAGAEYDLGKNVFLAIRYNHGFEQIVEDAVGFTMRNRYLSFKIGWSAR